MKTELENNKKSVLIKVINEFKLKRSKMNTFFKEANKDYFDAFQKYIVSLESEYEKFKFVGFESLAVDIETDPDFELYEESPENRAITDIV